MSRPNPDANHSRSRSRSRTRTRTRTPTRTRTDSASSPSQSVDTDRKWNRDRDGDEDVMEREDSHEHEHEWEGEAEDSQMELDMDDLLQLQLEILRQEGEHEHHDQEDEQGSASALAESVEIEASIDPTTERAQRRRRRQQQLGQETAQFASASSSETEGSSSQARRTRRRTSEDQTLQARLLSMIRRVAANGQLRGMGFYDDRHTAPGHAPTERKQELLTRAEDSLALDEFAHSIRVHDTTTRGSHNIWHHLPIASTGTNSLGRARGLGWGPIRHAPTQATNGTILSHFLPTTSTWQEQFPQRAFCGKFSKSGDVFCLASQDGVIHLYNSDFRVIKQIEARDVGWSIIDVDFSSDQRWVIYSSWSDYVHLCNVDGEYNLHEGLNFAPLGQACMFGVRFAPNNQDILAGLNHGHFILYDVERKQRLIYGAGHDDDINSVCYIDESSNLFATGSDDTTCHIWDRRTIPMSNSSRPKDVDPVGGFIGHAQGLTCVASRNDGRYILTNSKDQCMKLWDLRKMSTPSQLAHHHVARRASDRTIDYRWHAYRRDGRRQDEDHSLMTYLSHTVRQTLVRCDFSPLASTGHRYVYTGSSNGVVYIYDAITGATVSQLDGHHSIVRDVSWHPYKPMLMSTSWDCTCRRWEYSPSESDEGEGEAKGERQGAGTGAGAGAVAGAPSSHPSAAAHAAAAVRARARDVARHARYAEHEHSSDDEDYKEEEEEEELED